MSTVLLIDDNRDILGALAQWIGMHVADCTVLMANNGQEGIAMMDSVPVDFILTDLQMPVMDGYHVVEHRNRKHPHVPLAAATADRAVSVTKRLQALGVPQCFEKPFEFGAVARMIAENLKRSPLVPVPAAGGAEALSRISACC